MGSHKHVLAARQKSVSEKGEDQKQLLPMPEQPHNKQKGR